MNQPTLLIEDDYTWDGMTEYDLVEEIAKTGNRGLMALKGNIDRRAPRLWEEGYTREDMEGVPTGHLVITPTKTYAHRVYTYPKHRTVCTCPCYRKWTYCKHALAIDAMLSDRAAQDAAMIAEYEARQAMIDAAEDAEFGIAPEAQF